MTRCFHTRDHVHTCGLKIKAHLLRAVMRRHAASVSLRLHYRKQQPLITQPALMSCTCRLLCNMLTTATAADRKDKYLGGSRECHFVYAHVRGDGSPRRWTVSWQNIDDSRWKPSLSKQHRRKQSLAEITTEPSKTAKRCGENPDPTQDPSQQRTEETSKRRRSPKRGSGRGGRRKREWVQTPLC